VLSPVILGPHPIGTLGKMWRHKHTLHSFNSALLPAYSLLWVGRDQLPASWTLINSHQSSLALGDTVSVSHGGTEFFCCHGQRSRDMTVAIVSSTLRNLVHASSFLLVASYGPRTLRGILRWESVAPHTVGRTSRSIVVHSHGLANSTASFSCRSGYHCSLQLIPLSTAL
jgi:hypothetical protein